MSDLIDPVEVNIKDSNGDVKTFRLGKMPATVGREVLSKFTLSNLPKVGEYDISHQAMLKMMKYVETEDGIRLSTSALVDNHVPDGEALMRIEIEMLRHNTSFFGRAGSQSLGGFLLDRIREYTPSITQTLTGFLQQLSQQDSQPSQSSKPPSA